MIKTYDSNSHLIVYHPIQHSKTITKLHKPIFNPGTWVSMRDRPWTMGIVIAATYDEIMVLWSRVPVDNHEMKIPPGLPYFNINFPPIPKIKFDFNFVSNDETK